MRYWDRVRVTSWFYEGMEGTLMKKELESYRTPFSRDDISVAVKYTILHEWLYWKSLIEIYESNLEIIN